MDIEIIEAGKLFDCFLRTYKIELKSNDLEESEIFYTSLRCAIYLWILWFLTRNNTVMDQNVTLIQLETCLRLSGNNLDNLWERAILMAEFGTARS